MDTKKKVPIAQLKTGKIWTNWKYIDKNGKQTKMPTSKVNDPATWITYAQAEQNTEWSNQGIGIMFAQNHKTGLALCGIDIDAHHVDTNPLTAEILEMFGDTYIEQSPSGKGYHVLFFAQLDKLPTEQDYKRTYKQKNTELDVECYISGMTNRYFTFTGKQTSESDSVTDMTDTLLEFLEKYMPLSPPVSLEEPQLKLTEEEGSYNTIDIDKRLEIAMNAKNGSKFTALYHGDTSGYGSNSEAVQAFVDMLVFYFGDGGASLVKDVYMRSGMATGKWAERDSIIDTTISKAFQRVSERYQAHQNSSKNNTTGEKEDKKPKKLELDFELFSEFIKENGYTIRYNVITHDFEFFGFATNESKEHLAENVPIILYDGLRKRYNHVTINILTAYITRYATQNKYNPVLNAIQSVKWDGKDRVTEIYDIFKIPADKDGTYSRVFIFKWLCQCICGLFNSDVDTAYSLDIILVFKGKQGIGKTRFFEKLALKSSYFGEGICLDPRDKDSIMQATSKWISELGEIGSTMRKDMDSVKAFLTKATDEYRVPYGKASLHYPRMTSFVGTVNDDKFLIDQTGNRRFVTIPLSEDLKIDYSSQIESFDALQLWSQIYEYVKDKDKARCFRLTDDEKEYLEKRNSDFVKPMKAEDEILDILEQEQTAKQGYICTTKDMTVTEFIALHNLKYDARTVGKVLNKYGYESKWKRLDGKPTRMLNLPYRKYIG